MDPKYSKPAKKASALKQQSDTALQRDCHCLVQSTRNDMSRRFPGPAGSCGKTARADTPKEGKASTLQTFANPGHVSHQNYCGLIQSKNTIRLHTIIF